MKRSLALASLALALLSLSACNTFRGIGQDLQAVGNGVTEAAEDTQEFLAGEKDTRTASANTACDPEPALKGGNGNRACR